MAANPNMRKLEKYVAANGGDSCILDLLSDGWSVRRIAESISLPGHGTISRPFLYRWRNRDDERVKAWAVAMKTGAHALAEDSGEVLEELPEDPTSAQVAKAKGISEHRKWLAGKRNDDYDAKPAGLNVNILSAGDLHLDALRQAGHMDRAALPEPTPEPIQIPCTVEEEA